MQGGGGWGAQSRTKCIFVFICPVLGATPHPPSLHFHDPRTHRRTRSRYRRPQSLSDKCKQHACQHDACARAASACLYRLRHHPLHRLNRLSEHLPFWRCRGHRPFDWTYPNPKNAPIQTSPRRGCPAAGRAVVTMRHATVPHRPYIQRRDEVHWSDRQTCGAQHSDAAASWPRGARTGATRSPPSRDWGHCSGWLCGTGACAAGGCPRAAPFPLPPALHYDGMYHRTPIAVSSPEPTLLLLLRKFSSCVSVGARVRVRVRVQSQGSTVFRRHTSTAQFSSKITGRSVPRRAAARRPGPLDQAPHLW